MCAPFFIPRRAAIKCTPKPAPPPAAGKKCTHYPDTRSARRLAIPAAGLRFSLHKVHILGRPVSRHKVHIFTAPLSPFFSAFFFLFLKKCIYYPDTAAAGRENKKVHTLAGHHNQSRSGHKVHTLGRPVLFAKSMHTRQPQVAKKCIH